ncbi:MAG: hypothetical protein ACTSYR_06385 [Candidatus Odinarchaeia archaeon]
MVTTPICSFCARTGMLCQSCQEKLKRGEITEEDVKIAKELITLESRFTTLKDVILKKIVHTPVFNILVVNNGAIPNLIGPKGKILKELEKVANKKLRVIEEKSDYLKVIEDIVTPMRVLGVNRIFLPTGETVQKVRIQNTKGTKQFINTELLEKIIFELTGKLVRLSFE